MDGLRLTAEEESQAERIYEGMREAFEKEGRLLSRLLASKPDSEILGQTEYQVRDAVHRLGAQAIELALAERKKRGTKDRA
jgi:hypothetical protein